MGPFTACTSSPKAARFTIVLTCLYLLTAINVEAVPSVSTGVLSSLSRTLRGDMNVGRTATPYGNQSPGQATANSNNVAVIGVISKNATRRYPIPTIMEATGPGRPATMMPVIEDAATTENPEASCRRHSRYSNIRFPGCVPVMVDKGACKGSCVYGGHHLTGNLSLTADDVYRFPTTSIRSCKCCRINKREVKTVLFLCTTPSTNAAGRTANIEPVRIKIEVVASCKCRKCYFKRPHASWT